MENRVTERPNTAQSIERRQLTTWAVMPGGQDIRLDLGTADGKPSSMVFSFEALSILLMTLPRMLQAALDSRCSDGSLRLTQVLGSWRLEQAQGDPSLILKLSTRDGFEVAFALNGKDADSLGLALVATSRTTETSPATCPH